MGRTLHAGAVLAWLLLPQVLLHADVPTVITYQGALTDTAGKPANGTFSMTFAMYQNPTGGAAVWTESNAGVQVSNGVFTVVLGGTSSLPAGLKNCYYLQVSVGGTAMLPRQMLTSAPFALGIAAGAQATGSRSDFAFGAQNSSTANGAAGLYGLANGATGRTFGVYGQTNSTTNSAAGLYGLAWGTTGITRGVFGQTNSTTDSAAGLYGLATGGSGITRGVYGQTNSTTSWAAGLYGLANGATGRTLGVYGETESTSDNAAGLHGLANGATGATNGVFGQTKSTDANAAGLRGVATATTGAASGASGTTSSPNGNGVYGVASATSGNNAGVHGTTGSSEGVGVYGSAPTHGVVGEAFAAGDGVYGVASATSGDSAGVHGTAGSPKGIGVHGSAPAHGVVGESTNSAGESYGVEGRTHGPNGVAISGLGATGVRGQTDSASGGATGVFGLAPEAIGMTRGVYGQTNSTDGWATGVSGLAAGSSGATFGVMGQSYSEHFSAGVYGRGPASGVLGETVHSDGCALRARCSVSDAWGLYVENGKSYIGGALDVYGPATFPGGVTGPVTCTAAENGGFAVKGTATGTGNTKGMWGVAGADGTGVYGFGGWTGVFGEGSTGVHGFGLGSGGVGSGGVGVWAEARSGSGKTWGLFAQTVSPDGRAVEALSVDPNGYGLYVSGGKSYFAGPATFHGGHADGDLAENRPARGVEAGDVVVIGRAGELVRCTRAGDTAVAGIISTNPTMKVGGLADGSTAAPLALVGVVPCKVDAARAPIHAGDLLTTSTTPGHAMKCTSKRPPAGAIVGKALEDLESGRGVIQVLVTLR